jgi:transcriptional regulator with XRE-family HTH domain
MNYADVCRHFGTQSAIARALGISVQAVSRWKRSGIVPLARQYEIQILTGGHLRASLAHRTTSSLSGPIRPRRSVENNIQTGKKTGVSLIDSVASL